jgi:hypothetical protein
MNNLLTAVSISFVISSYVFVACLLFGSYEGEENVTGKAIYAALSVFFLIVGLTSIVVIMMEILNAFSQFP